MSFDPGGGLPIDCDGLSLIDMALALIAKRERKCL
jgi:hypothetical protein